MPEMPQAVPCPDRPPLHLKGGFLAVASPTRIEEACFAVPAIRALKQARPQGTLAMVTPAFLAPLWRAMRCVNRVIEYDVKSSPRKVAHLLKESGIPFDSSIAWEKNTAAIAFRKAGIHQRLGHPTKELEKLITDPVPIVSTPGPIQHRIRDYLLFLKKLNVDAFAPINFQSPPRPDPPTRPRVALAPGSDFGKAAEWSHAHFLSVAQSLEKEYELHLFTSPDRAQPAEQLAKSLPAATLHDSLKNLADTLDLLATCEHFIGCDGALPHLAAHTGTKCTVIFGPNEPAWKRPLGTIHQILREHVPCSPCFLDKCPLDHRCLRGITPEMVLQTLRRDA